MRKLILSISILLCCVAVSSAGPLQRAHMAVLSQYNAGGGGTTLTFIASATAESAAATGVTCSKPTGTAENDIMIALVQRYQTEEAVTVPSGWTLIDTEQYGAGARMGYLYYKVAGGSEGADYTWDYTNSVRIKIDIATYRGGFDTADPIDAYINTNYADSDTTLRAYSVTATAADSPLLFIGGGTISNVSTTCTAPPSPSGFSEDVDSYSTTSDFLAVFYSMTLSGSGATGDMDATTSETLSYKGAFSLVLNPD